MASTPFIGSWMASSQHIRVSIVQRITDNVLDTSVPSCQAWNAARFQLKHSTLECTNRPRTRSGGISSPETLGTDTMQPMGMIHPHWYELGLSIRGVRTEHRQSTPFLLQKVPRLYCPRMSPTISFSSCEDEMAQTQYAVLPRDAHSISHIPDGNQYQLDSCTFR
ncbi:hypothetical protein B0H34DRAFT_418875 [Crassisporium funariophilum]|nr:hypothetical protein B0H34DRAFT_418875 [Crassisporium funariophilum]